MSPQNLDPESVMAVFEDLVRDDVVPTRSSERLIGAAGAGAIQKFFSTPHRVFRVELQVLADGKGLWSEHTHHVGWQTMVFDGEFPVCTPEISIDSPELATSGNEHSAKDLARALNVAREASGNDETPFDLLRIPHFATILLLPAQHAAIALPTSRLPENVRPFQLYGLEELGASLRDAAHSELNRAKVVQERQLAGAPPHTFREPENF